MADELDLEKGDASRAEERRARRQARTGSSETKTGSEKLDKELHDRLMGAFQQVQEWREARDDEELATAIDEDKDKMSKGLVSLTHVIDPLRRPLLIFLGFVEPVLAFGRVGRILGGRFIAMRQARADDLAQRQAEWDAQNVTTNAGQPGAYAVP